METYVVYFYSSVSGCSVMAKVLLFSIMFIFNTVSDFQNNIHLLVLCVPNGPQLGGESPHMLF